MLSTILSWLSQVLDKVTTQGLTAAAALAGAIVGPVVAFVIGKRQIRASIVSASRQVWINNLRNDVTELMLLRIEFSALFLPAADGENIICTDQGKADSLVDRIRFLLFKIELSLNPEEALHQKLVELLGKAPAPPLNKDLNAEILRTTQNILRAEWKRTASAE